MFVVCFRAFSWLRIKLSKSEMVSVGDIDDVKQ
jgi:hypothetical protein